MIPNIKEHIDLIIADGDKALPIVSIIADHLSIPMLWKRTKIKDHGLKKQYEGDERLLLTSKKIFILSYEEMGEKIVDSPMQDNIINI